MLSHTLADASPAAAQAAAHPAGWRMAQLGEFVDSHKITLTNGFAQGGFNEDGRGVPHLRPFNVSEDGRIDLTHIKSVPTPRPDSSYWVKQGDIIFNNTNSEDLVGKTAYFPLDGAFVLSNHMTRIRVAGGAQLDAAWLAYYLLLQWNHRVFKALCRRHVGQASISLDKLSGLSLVFPPLPEQRAIARVLRAAQDAIAARRRQVGLERERKAALMQRLFTRGTRGEATRQTEIGEAPESWQVVRLADVCNSSAYGPRFSGDLYHVDGNVATLRTTDISDDGAIDYSTMPLAKLDLDRFENHLLKEHDFLITRSGTCGIASVFEGFSKPVLPGAFLIRFRLATEKLSPYFLREYINSSHGRERISLLAVGAVQKNISGSAALMFSVPIPQVEEQIAIVDVAQRTDAHIAALEREIALGEELFRALLEALMSGRLSARELVEEVAEVVSGHDGGV